LKPYESGFIVKGDAKGIVSLFNHSENQVILTTQNKDSLITHSYLIENNNKIIDPKDASWAHIKLKNGRTRKHEFYYGSSYLSQSSRKMIVLDYYKEIVLHQQNTETTISKNF
ncbi:MAG: hypothetical protein KAQ62_11540, partial [Cyclobacteriaceae bacterium]|nr:hypothetical protein [Cyclobacteriaceae bacterium]MCK5369181.1 hypothetical protein [Cyclobacteriaceae bacterium]MCK5469435.1 hypothetical protein [Cyclobacteriaceae bacterium]